MGGQLEARLADAENAAARGGKAAMAKLENKVHELEAELAGTQARTGESAKAYQRAERKCKELSHRRGATAADDDDDPQLDIGVAVFVPFFNGRISGIWLWRRDRRTSWARSSWGRLRGAIDRRR